MLVELYIYIQDALIGFPASELFGPSSMPFHALLWISNTGCPQLCFVGTFPAAMALRKSCVVGVASRLAAVKWR